MSSPWWHATVIYQLYVFSFSDANADGYGDLDGILERLDYLSDTLGVGTVWLSPIYPSPWADHGYDVADYTDIHPRFGDLATFDRLVREAHARDLRVILDWVPNHTSDEHPWFRESRSSRQSQKRDWYYWRDPGPDGGPPNNWQSPVRGSVWAWDDATRQYYLHTYLPKQPDLNWRNPAVEEAMLDTLRFWLDRDVDGFRIDVAHRILKDPQFRDNPPNPDGISDYHKPMGPDYLSQIHVHDQFQDDVHAVYRRIRKVLDGYGERIGVPEVHLAGVADWASFYGGEALDELHLPLNFRLMGLPWEPAAIADGIERVAAALPPGAIPTIVLGNHDDHRLATRIGPAQARVAALLLLTLRGVPFIYQGDELGMTDVDVPPQRRRDPFGEAGGRAARDAARTPMQWDASEHAGFMPSGAGEPWLPVGNNRDTVNVADELGDPHSLLNLYRRLLAFRKTSPALLEGDVRIVRAGDGCLVYERRCADEQLAIALNLTPTTRSVTLPGSGRVVVATSRSGEGERTGPELVLAADEGLCVRMDTGEVKK